MYENFIKIINKNNGVITSKEAQKQGISRTVLKKMVDSEVIERIDYGIYATDQFVYDEYYLFQIKHNNVVFSYNSALYLLGMTERVPSKIEVTTSKNNSLYYCKEEANIHRVSDKILNLGKIKVKTMTGQIVSCYNLERTVCDIINNKSTIDIEIANKAIKKCIRSKEFNDIRMFEYARKMKIYEKVKIYMEAIL